MIQWSHSMSLIDFILNLAGLLLWLNWRAAKVDPLGKRTPATLIGTLRRADSRGTSRWQLPAILGGLLLLRALFYWQIGSAFKPVWAGRLDLGVTELSFRSDFFSRMLLFSFSSFALMLAMFYLWLLLLSILAGPEPFHALVRTQLGPLDRWPRPVKWLLPFVAAAIAWWLASWLFAALQIIPPPGSPVRRLAGALIIGLDSYLAWKFIIGAMLALHLLNSYVYFGKHPFWGYVNTTAQTLLRPLKQIPLRAGKADFAPVAAIALTFLIAEMIGRLLDWLYGRLSF
jgi:uncharacterized protein YggT (Ycf19 family)